MSVVLWIVLQYELDLYGGFNGVRHFSLSIFQPVVDDAVRFFRPVEQFVSTLRVFDASDYDFRRVENSHGFLSDEFRPLVLDYRERDATVGVELTALPFVLMLAHIVGRDIGQCGSRHVFSLLLLKCG